MRKRYLQLHSFVKNPPVVLFIGVLIFLSFVFRVFHLSSNPIGLDEPFSIFHAQMKISEIIHNLKGGNNPPFYEIILHFWIKRFGIGSFSVRFPSLVFSVINVLFVFLIANKFVNLRTALLASLLIGLSNYHIYFSHEARVYSLFSLLTTISFYLIFLLIADGLSKLKYGMLFLIYFTLVFSHYLGFIVVIFQLIVMIFFSLYKKIEIKKYLSVILLLILAYSLYIPELYSRFTDSVQNGTWLKPVENLGNLHDIIFLLSNSNKPVYLLYMSILWSSTWIFMFKLNIHKYFKTLLLYVVIPVFFLTSCSIFFKMPFIWRLTSLRIYTFIFVLVILSFILFFVFKNKKDISYKFLLLIWFIVPLLLFFAISFYIPVFLDRYLVFIIPAFYLTISISMNAYYKGRYFYLVSALMVLLMIFSLNVNNKENEGVEKTVQQIKKLRGKSTKIIICPKQFKLTFLYHYNPKYFSDYKNVLSNLMKDNIYIINNSSELGNILSAYDSDIIYVNAYSEFIYPNNGVYKKLEEDYNLDDKFEFRKSLIIYDFSK